MRVYKNKAGTRWLADIRGLDGVGRTRRSLGTVSGVTEEQARVKAYGLAGRIVETERAKPAGPPDAGTSGLHAALLLWLRLRTRGRSDKSIARVLKDIWPDCPAAEVTNVTAAARLGHLADGTFDRYVSTINAALKAAGHANRLAKRNEARSEAPRYLSEAEWLRLKPCLPEHLLAAAEFALATGLRRSNVFGLQWRNVSIQNRTVTVWAGGAKGRRTLHLPLSAWAVAVLQRQQGLHSEVVFPAIRRTKKRLIITPMSDPKTAFAAALTKAGIKDFVWHGFRHTWATWAVQSGMPLKVLQELGGWATLDMVMVYAHAAPSHLQHWADAVQAPVQKAAKAA
jgi:integrase